MKKHLGGCISCLVRIIVWAANSMASGIAIEIKEASWRYLKGMMSAHGIAERDHHLEAILWRSTINMRRMWRRHITAWQNKCKIPCALPTPVRWSLRRSMHYASPHLGAAWCHRHRRYRNLAKSVCRSLHLRCFDARSASNYREPAHDQNGITREPFLMTPGRPLASGAAFFVFRTASPATSWEWEMSGVETSPDAYALYYMIISWRRAITL